MAVQKFLFVPVSSPKGVGEYMRSQAVAKKLQRDNPDADIAFVLSAEAPYHKDCPFKVFLTPQSPTKHSSMVNKVMDEFQPQLVLFDASGRVAQFRHAKAIGAKTVFTCQHNAKVRRGMRLRRWRYTDEIWRVQAHGASASYSSWQRLKSKILNKPLPIPIGPIFPLPEPEKEDTLLHKHGLQKNNYLIVSSGSGGHYVEGKNAQETFNEAALIFANKHKLETRVVFGPNYSGSAIKQGYCASVSTLEGGEFVTLLGSAKLALISAGSTLFQCASLGVQNVSVSVAGDQAERLEWCEQRNLTTGAALNVNAIVSALESIDEQPQKIDRTLVENGLITAVNRMKNLVGE